jgi:hypothetical protein
LRFLEPVLGFNMKLLLNFFNMNSANFNVNIFLYVRLSI